MSSRYGDDPFAIEDIMQRLDEIIEVKWLTGTTGRDA